MGALSCFLSGDVMLGRGLDQALLHPGAPVLHEGYVRDARHYVELAEQVAGPISRPLDYRDPWGVALEILERLAPDARIINLETAVTTSTHAWPGKGVHYRMHPHNLPAITAAGVDVCVLANNHVLDWGREGLAETLDTLEGGGLKTAGAGRDLRAAQAPAVVERASGRILVFGMGSLSSGIPWDWGAGAERPGVHLVDETETATIESLRRLVDAHVRPGDLVVASIHWGPNWGSAVSDEQVVFARGLVEQAGVHVVHGHSSHHVKALEVHQGCPIMYGCGDLIDDYEGIPGHEEHRPDLGLLYLVRMDSEAGHLQQLHMAPTRMRGFRLEDPPEPDVAWLAGRLAADGRCFGTDVIVAPDRSLKLRW